jgi:hypothetical protein
LLILRSFAVLATREGSPMRAGGYIRSKPCVDGACVARGLLVF